MFRPATCVLLVILTSAALLPAQAQNWTQNGPRISATLNGVQVDPFSTDPATTVVPYFPACTPVQPGFVEIEFATTIPVALHELVISPLPLVPAGDPNSIFLAPNQFVHIDLLSGVPPLFLYGGTPGPLFQPLSGTLPLPPVPVLGGFSLSTQAMVLDPAAPTGLSVSQATSLEVVPSLIAPPQPGPTGDDDVATVIFSNLGNCQPNFPSQVDIPGLGPIDRVHVMSNGRMILGGPVPTPNFQPSPQAALFGPAFFGFWTDLDPSAGGEVRIVTDAASVLRVEYDQVPYFGENATVSFALELDLNDGSMLIRDLSGVNPNPLSGFPSAGDNQFIGLSLGNGLAFDPGPLLFAQNPQGLYPSPNEMIFEFHDPGFFPGGLAPSFAQGLDILALVPLQAQPNPQIEWVATLGPRITPPSLSLSEEMRAYAAEAWASYDQGFPTAGANRWSWTNRATLGPDFDPFGHAEAIFHAIYGHRLGEQDQVLDDLLAGSDPALLQAFRHYTITGELETTAQGDPIAHANHLRAAREALLSGAEYAVQGILDLNAGLLRTFGLVAVGKDPKRPINPPAPGNPNNLPANKRAIDTQLRAQAGHLTQRSANNPGGVTYVPDGNWSWSTPGFDCDDFADSMANHIARTVPGTTTSRVRVGWCAPGWRSSWQYHAITRVDFGGCYWLMDAQSGGIIGPFAANVPMDASALCRGPYQVGAQSRFWTSQGTQAVGARSGLREPAPWWTDADRRAQIDRERGNWRNYAPPGYVPN